ncbi:MAG TPA: zinc-binding dehydrogenase [Candidatus Thermoplasmatota archaeon]|nr:zinc-binding dehydrogenase [Candidatus Thermoplasmatota archaeon]
MKAAYFERHGGLEVLKVGELPSPPLGPADVRVNVKAAALNHLDLFVREGWPGLKLPLPHIGGTDLAGVVSEVGDAVKGVKVGDEVLVNPGLNFKAGPDGEQLIPPDVSIVGETRWGGLAEECVVPATHVVPKPDSLTWEEAAALPLAAITAMQMVKRRGRVKRGDKVLVVGAGGGVAVMAVQVAKAMGAWVCATTGGPEKVAKVRGLGADHVIDYKAEPEWSKAAFLASGKVGYDVVIDSVGQATFKGSIRALRHGGRFVTCGATTGPVGELDLRLVFWKQLSVLGSTMGIPQDLEDALAMVRSGHLRVFVDSVWPLDQAKEAQAKMERAEQFGKIVLRP